MDCTGKIVERWQEGDSLWIKVQVPSADVMKYIVPKGFICVDGTSLTVCDVHRNHGISENFADPAGWFTLMLVAHTQQNVIFPLRKEGDLVNLEVDIIGKLVEQSVSASVASMKSVVEDLATASLQSEQWIIDLERRVDELEGKLRGER